MCLWEIYATLPLISPREVLETWRMSHECYTNQSPWPSPLEAACPGSRPGCLWFCKGCKRQLCPRWLAKGLPHWCLPALQWEEISVLQELWAKSLERGPRGWGEPLDLGLGECSPGGDFDLETVLVDAGRFYSGQGGHHRWDTNLSSGTMWAVLCAEPSTQLELPLVSQWLRSYLATQAGVKLCLLPLQPALDFSSIYHPEEMDTYLLTARCLFSSTASIWRISSLELSWVGWDRTLLSSCITSAPLLITDGEGFLTIQHSLSGWQPWPEHGLELGFLELSLD